MGDPLSHLLKCRKRLVGLSRARQKNILMSIFILMLGIGLFFFLPVGRQDYFSQDSAYAQKTRESLKVSLEVIDPWHKIGKGLIKEEASSTFCADSIIAKKEIPVNPKFSAMLNGSPMEKMIPALNKRNNEVASYLIAIAKKESDWGKHTPKKGGRECYNFWGYRGKENTTDSGYSCFDSPSHAVEVVGNRVEKLLDSNVNTPAKMVVWKCGSDCEAAGGQAAANKWISDVASYYKKLNS